MSFVAPKHNTKTAANGQMAANIHICSVAAWEEITMTQSVFLLQNM